MLAHAALLLVLLVGIGRSVQEILADKDMVVKIAASGKLIQCSAAIDLLLLLDGSYSVGKGSFERSKHFATKLLDVLDINPDRVRVGAIQFSSKPGVEFGFSDCPTREEAHQAIQNIAFRGGSTEAGRAVHYVLKKGLPGGRTKVPRILLLLTDGRSQDNLKGAAQLAKKSGIKVFAVGVRHPDWDVLHAVASEPTELYVFSAELHQDSVNGLLTTLTQTAVCSDVHPLCRVESRVCFRTTVQSLREHHGNHMCWKKKGHSRQARPMVGTCPFYSWRRVSKTIQSQCYRTICPDPCESSPCLNGGTCMTESVEEHSCLCPLGFRADKNCGGGKYIVPAGLLDCSVDLVFLIDGSWKSGLEDFNLAKDFIRRFVLSTSSSSSTSKIHLAVAQYADEVVVEVPPGRYGNAADFLAALEEVPFRGGATLTGAALGNMAENECWFPPERERGFRVNVPHVMVLISGAKSKDAVPPGVERVRQRELFLLAVGPTRMQGELTRMTSDPDVVYTYNNAQGVARKIEELKSRICGITAPGCYGKSLDLVFLVDSSSSISRSDYLHVKAFVKSVIASFDLEADLTQVAMVIYGAKPRTVFGLSSFDSETGVKKAVANAPYLGGAPLVAKAMNYTLQSTLGVRQGARPGVHKVVVLVTDGHGSPVGHGGDAGDVAAATERLRETGILLQVIGPGPSQSQALVRTAGSESRTMAVPSYGEMKMYVNNLVQRICQDVHTPVRLCVPNPCLNGGVCVLTHESYRCQCQGWDGGHCEKGIGFR